MTEKKYEKAFGLDMPFDEALKRFAKTKPHEIQAEQKAKPKKRKHAPAQGPSSDQDVTETG